MLKKLLFTAFILIWHTLWASGSAGENFYFDFEQGSGNKLPQRTRQVISTDSGGTIRVIPESGLSSEKKALFAAVDKKKPEARFLILKKFIARSGQTLQFEGLVKGKGIAVFGIYGYDSKSRMISYRTAATGINSEQWIPIRKEITLNKSGIKFIYPFLQSNRGAVYFSPFTIRIKGVGNGFLDRDQKQTPLSWKKHSPHGVLTSGKEHASAKESFLQLHSGSGNEAVIVSEEQRALCGEDVRVSFLAKGSGKLNNGMKLISAQGKTQPFYSPAITLTPDWKEYTTRIRIPNGKDFETRKGRISFRLHKNGSAQIHKIKVYWNKRLHAGDIPFPTEGIAFPLLPDSFMPRSGELHSIPRTLNGVKGVKVKLNNGLADLSIPMKGVKEKNCAWVYYRILAPFACDYTLGAGADWWMTLYLNGKKVLDTAQTGNGSTDCSLLDQTATVRLQKGVNILAVKFKSGKTSSILCVGGPNEITRYSKDMVRTGTLKLDDYTNRNIQRSGAPQYVKRITMPGNMTMNQVGLYKENARIAPFPQKFSFKNLETDSHFGQSILLVEFPAKGSNNTFSSTFQAGANRFSCVLINKNKLLFLYVTENGKRVSPLIYAGNAAKMFPCDLSIYTDRQGCVRLFLSSRADARYYKKLLWDSPVMKEIVKGKFQVYADLKLTQQSSAALDDYGVVTGVFKEEQKNIPFLLDTAETFDPVKAKWPLVMEDDFNGTVLDMSKWKVDGRKDPNQTAVTLNGKGFLVIKADWNKDKTRLTTRRLWSRRTFKYGYFEARLRFTKQPGWWSSFFMMSPIAAGTPFYGVEFDFYEDYYTRPERKGAPFRNILDSTAYAGYPRAYKHPAKIWNYHSRIPGSLEDFYTLGVKWTPFEISYYLNGKRLPGFLKFSPHNTVTFDAFNHCAVACGTQMVFAGEIGMGNPKEGKYPDYFLVDYFRAYAMPQDDLPAIQWINEEKRNLFVKKGEVLHFEVKALPSPKTRSPIRGVYLFDNGYFIAKKETPPYKFSIPMTEEFYKTTQYLVPGLSKGTPMNPPPFEGPFPHSFAVFVQDENGQGAMTSIKQYILHDQKSSTPYQGKAQVIPGVIHLPFFDEGGQNAAYHWGEKGGRDQTFRKEERVYATKQYVELLQACNYLKFTVDVKQSGLYDVTFRYACVSPTGTDSWAKLYVNGMEKAVFTLENNGRYSTPSQKVRVRNVPLKAGRQTLLVLLNMKGFAADLTFKKQ